MSDARRRAEEALATMNGVLLAWGPQPPMSKSAALCHAISVGTVALEALLAAEPAKGAKRCAGECPDCHGAGLYGVTDENGDQDTVICRHPAPPAGAEVRGAEAVLAEAREAMDEIRRRSTDKLAGGIAASFLGAHPRAALRGGQKGGE